MQWIFPKVKELVSCRLPAALLLPAAVSIEIHGKRNRIIAVETRVAEMIRVGKLLGISLDTALQSLDAQVVQ